SLLALYKSAITASVGGGAGNGGNITTINSAPKLFVLNNGSIVAQAAAGHGGNILIHAKNFLQSADSVVSASSDLGIDGSVRIYAPEGNMIARLVVLPADFSESSLSLKSCPGRLTKDTSRLTIKKRDGPHTAPGDMF
ncbi:MAG: hypothetical protein GY862_24640, partial [Gammaproteobacteria bacterium]|nr:hypothetical protein [Gammaproteobacteria bacterium]